MKDILGVLPSKSPGITAEEVSGVVGIPLQSAKDILDAKYARGDAVRIPGVEGGPATYYRLEGTFLSSIQDIPGGLKRSLDRRREGG